MTNTPPSIDAKGYLESLMRTGRDAVKQFGEALVSAVGLGGKDAPTPGADRDQQRRQHEFGPAASCRGTR